MRSIHDLVILAVVLVAAGCAGSQGGSVIPTAGVANPVGSVSRADSGLWTQPIVVVNQWKTPLVQQSNLPGCWQSSGPVPRTVEPGASSPAFEVLHNAQCADGPLHLLWGASIYLPYSCYLVVTQAVNGYTYTVKNEAYAACRVHQNGGTVYLDYRLRKQD